MAIQITRTELSDEGSTHQHISRLWWWDAAAKETKISTRAEIVSFIEDDKGEAYTKDDAGHRAEVQVRTPAQGPKYVQTKADGIWTDNLLALAK